MSNYREILRQNSLGISGRNIANSCSCSRNTVSKILKQAEKFSITWKEISSKTNAEIEVTLFPSKHQSLIHSKKLPDFNYIRKELLKNGVNKKLLWTEYLEVCKLNGDEPLM